MVEIKRLPQIINIQENYGTGVVRTQTGKKFLVTLTKEILGGIHLFDYVELRKSPVTHEWVVTDYHINLDVYENIPSSSPKKYGDMVL